MHDGRPSRSRLLRTERRGKATLASSAQWTRLRTVPIPRVLGAWEAWEGWTRRRDWSTERAEPRVRRAWEPWKVKVWYCWATAGERAR